MQYMKVVDVLREVDKYMDMGCRQSLMRLLEEKFDECTPAFIDSILEDGMKRPVYIKDGKFWNGHHRFAVAVFGMLDSIPVTTDEDESYNFSGDEYSWSEKIIFESDLDRMRYKNGDVVHV